MNAGPVPFELAIWVFGGLATIIGGLLLHLFNQNNKKLDLLGEKQDAFDAKLDKKIDDLNDKIDTNEAQNHADHRIVDRRLASIESRLSTVETKVNIVIDRNTARDEE